MSKAKRAMALLAAICVLLVGCSRPIERDPIEGPDRAHAATSTRSRERLDLPSGGAKRNSVTIGGVRYDPKEDLMNVLLIGVDKDSTRTGVGRADMIVLCTLDPHEGTISLLTVPRDTHAWVHHISEDGEIQDTVYEKINHSYAYGLGPTKYSAENTMACTSRLLECDGQLEVPIHYYLSMDLDGLWDLADVFGGVAVTLDQDVPNVGAEGETVTLQGPTVRYYLEARHGMDEGEVSRQIHQQTFLKALMQAIKDKGGAAAAADLYTIFARFMRTNLSARQFASCIKLLDGVNVEDISIGRVMGEGITMDDVWYLEPDPIQMRDLVLAHQYEAAG